MVNSNPKKQAYRNEDRETMSKGQTMSGRQRRFIHITPEARSLHGYRVGTGSL